MDSRRPRAIVSLHADDPDQEEAIAAFVVALGERVDALQDAEAAGDSDLLRRLAHLLAEDANGAGYPSLCRAARAVAAACAEGAPEARTKAVVDLTELSQAVRLGHRSAAG